MIKIVSPFLLKCIYGKKDVAAFTSIPPFVIFKSKSFAENKILVNHEAIHLRQYYELAIIFKWPLYLWFSLSRGYKNNPFEMEAYYRQSDLTYLKNRKWLAWRKFV